MIDIYDNVLEPHVSELIHTQMEQLYWRYNYNSSKGQVNKHWHVLAGHNPEAVKQNGYEWLLPLWDTVFSKYNFAEKYSVDSFKRLYMNAHTHGIEPHLHTDDGDFTMIYYPQTNWKIEYGGGTFVYKEDAETVDTIAEYRGNRVLMFDAHLPHQAQSVAKNCLELRMCVVFKLWTEGANRERLDFYKDTVS